LKFTRRPPPRRVFFAVRIGIQGGSEEVRGVQSPFTDGKKVTHLWHEVLPDVAYDCLESLARAVRGLVPGLHREPFSDAVLVAAVAVDPIPVVANAQVRGRGHAAPVELRVPDPCTSAALSEKQEGHAEEDET
jgi:hypothetical protein